MVLFLVFLEQSKTNVITRIDKETFAHKISEQILLPTDRSLTDKYAQMLHNTVENVPAYVLSCNMSTAAVDTVIEKVF